MKIFTHLDGLRVDGDVARLVAGEGDLAALLVAVGDLLSVRGPPRVLAHRTLAPQRAEVPGAVVLAGHDVGVLAGLPGQSEGVVLAAEAEG